MQSDDLSIPAFLRVTGPGTPHSSLACRFCGCTMLFPCSSAEKAARCPRTPDTASNGAHARPIGIAPGAWEEMQRPEHREAREAREAVREYENQKRLAELEQWRIENPDLARMERKAKRDAARRVSRLGIKATGRAPRKRRSK